MNYTPDNFRDKLLSAERCNPELKKKFDREIRIMLEHKLTKRRKLASLILSIALICQGLFLGWIGVAVAGIPPMARIGFLIGVVFSFSFAAFLIVVVIKGVYNLKLHPPVLYGMTWGFAVVFMVIIILFGLTVDASKASLLMDYGLFLFIMAAVFLIMSRIRQNELTTREKLLEIEYKMAELIEDMSRSNKLI